MAGSMVHLPGNFASCLEADAGKFRGKYCLLSMYKISSSAGQTLAHQLGLPEAHQQAKCTEYKATAQEQDLGDVTIWFGSLFFTERHMAHLDSPLPPPPRNYCPLMG